MTIEDIKIKIRFMRINRSRVLGSLQELEALLLEIEAGVDAGYSVSSMDNLMERKDLTVSMCKTELEMLSNQCEPLNRQIREVLQNQEHARGS